MRILLSLLALMAFATGNVIAEHHEEAKADEHHDEVSSTTVTGHEGEHGDEHKDEHHDEGEKH